MHWLSRIFWGLLFAVSVYQTLTFFWKNIRLNSLRGGWSSLRKYSIGRVPDGTSLLQTTSAKIGLVEYVGTIGIALDNAGVYLQRKSFLTANDVLYIPFKHFRFVEEIRSSWLGNGHIIFTVEGIDMWISQPFAGAILKNTVTV